MDERLEAVWGYAEKLTLEPQAVERTDVSELREAGLGEEAILHVVEIVAYFNFVNRMAEGLGVRLEDAWPHPPIGG